MATNTNVDRERRDSPTGESGARSQAGGLEMQGSQRTGTQQENSVAVSQGGQGGELQERGGQRGLARYGRDPFEMMQRMSDEMDQLFESFFYGKPMTRQSRQSGLQSLWAPEVEMAEEGNQLRVCIDLPGVPKDNVKVDIHDGVLTVQGERREERTEGGGEQGFRRSERRYGSFYRTIPLPEGVEADQAQARMKDGVLEITVPIPPAKQARRLEIQG